MVRVRVDLGISSPTHKPLNHNAAASIISNYKLQNLILPSQYQTQETADLVMVWTLLTQHGAGQMQALWHHSAENKQRKHVNGIKF